MVNVSQPRLQHVLRRYRTRLGAGQAGDVPDGELLDRFLEQRDEAAFAALMRRHGGLVMGVCRRVLRQAQDVEDACQATFLVLARKAGSIRRRESLSCWLHGVAYRVSVRLRAQADRSNEPSRDVSQLAGPEIGVESTWREAMQVLDEELARLPEHLRTPLVLCYLDGRTQDEAARRLGWTLGAFRGRLERGRAKLRARLIRRGVTLPAVLFGSALGGGPTAAMPSALLSTTTKAAAGVAAGTPVGAVVSTKVAALVEGMVNHMMLTKLKIAAAAFFLVVATAGAVAGFMPGPRHAAGVAEVGARAAQAEEKKDFERLKLDADDLADATGVNIYKFQVNVPKGQRFRVILREVPDNAVPRVLHKHSFLNETDGPTVIRVAFLRRDRQLAGVFLTGEKDAEYRVDCPGCDPSGIATIVTVPLADLPGTRKILFVSRSEKDAKQPGIKGMQLIAIVANEPGAGASPRTRTPRGELVIEPE